MSSAALECMQFCLDVWRIEAQTLVSKKIIVTNKNNQIILTVIILKCDKNS